MTKASPALRTLDGGVTDPVSQIKTKTGSILLSADGDREARQMASVDSSGVLCVQPDPSLIETPRRLFRRGARTLDRRLTLARCKYACSSHVACTAASTAGAFLSIYSTTTSSPYPHTPGYYCSSHRISALFTITDHTSAPSPTGSPGTLPRRLSVHLLERCSHPGTAGAVPGGPTAGAAAAVAAAPTSAAT